MHSAGYPGTGGSSGIVLSPKYKEMILGLPNPSLATGHLEHHPCLYVVPSQSSTSTFHSAMEEKKCEHCGREFARKDNMKRHLLKQHGIAPTVKEEKCVPEVPLVSPLRCTHCNKAFSSASNRRKHQFKVHHVQPDPHQVPTAIICKECSEPKSDSKPQGSLEEEEDRPSLPQTFNSLGEYRNHLKHHHGTPINKVDYTFTSSKEFMVWKDGLEVDVGVNYSRMRGALKTSTGTRSTYFCQSSGLQRVHLSKRKRARKSKGTCKLGLYCTSSMEVNRTSDDVIHVSFYPDHRNHNIDSPSLSSDYLVKKLRRQVESKTTLDLLPKVKETKDIHILKSVHSHLLKAIAIMDAETK